MNKNNDEKLRLNPWRIIKIFALTFLLFEIIFFISFQGSTSGTMWPLDSSFYYYTPALLVATGIFCYLSLTQTYYEIKGAIFTHTKMGKIVDYSFQNIVYVDKEFSESKKMIRFFTKEGTEHLLAFDKKRILYQTILEKSPLISLEEFERRFPNIKM